MIVGPGGLKKSRRAPSPKPTLPRASERQAHWPVTVAAADRTNAALDAAARDAAARLSGGGGGAGKAAPDGAAGRLPKAGLAGWSAAEGKRAEYLAAAPRPSGPRTPT